MDTVSRLAQRWRVLRPELNVEPMLIVGRVQRLWGLWDGRLRPTFEEASLHTGDFDALAALRRAGGPITPSDLSKEMLVTAGATTKRVDRLVAACLAERVPTVGDGRQRLVQITHAGASLADELMAIHLRVEDELLAPLAAEERTQLEGLLAKLLTHADRSGELPDEST